MSGAGAGGGAGRGGHHVPGFFVHDRPGVRGKRGRSPEHGRPPDTCIRTVLERIREKEDSSVVEITGGLMSCYLII